MIDIPLLTRLQDILKEAKKEGLFKEEVITKDEILLVISNALDVTSTTGKKYIKELGKRRILEETSGLMYKIDNERANEVLQEEI